MSAGRMINERELINDRMIHSGTHCPNEVFRWFPSIVSESRGFRIVAAAPPPSHDEATEKKSLASRETEERMMIAEEQDAPRSRRARTPRETHDQPETARRLNSTREIGSIIAPRDGLFSILSTNKTDSPYIFFALSKRAK